MPALSAESQRPANPVEGENSDVHDDLKAIVDFFVQQMQQGLSMDEVAQWISDQTPEYSRDLDIVMPIVREVRTGRIRTWKDLDEAKIKVFADILRDALEGI